MNSHIVSKILPFIAYSSSVTMFLTNLTCNKSVDESCNKVSKGGENGRSIIYLWSIW